MTAPGSYWHPFADMAAVAGHELVIARGKGVHVWDADGKRYLDGSASLWHCHVGHGREEIVEAIARQLRTLEAYQTFGDLANGPALELAARVAALSPMADPKLFLCLGGGDAIDTAAKLARQYWALQGSPERTHLISRSYAYHGTHGFGTSLAMEPLRQSYGPLVESVSHVAYDEAQALEDEIARVGPERVAAFFCEPVIGAGGVRPAPAGYIDAIGAICRRHGVLLVIDSVICGFGRLGTWLGYERFAIEPDMVVLAKGITSGYLPLGGVLVSSEVSAPFWTAPGRAVFRHGATYAGHPSCCAAALANLDILERERLIPRGQELEGELMAALAPLADHPAAGEIRGGLGLAAAVDLDADLLGADPRALARFTAAIREAGVLLRGQSTGVAIGPPLTIERGQLAEIAGAVRAGLDAVAN
ncbi:MAG: putrescine---pyruvate transaminase [Gaiellales bacterium]|jgi:adenosylmethionine-8-amino-7-oxononanoate aminotransferase|nr:putrescine---pyruvate transaminase [Gaiellales bacterium]